MTMPLPSFEHRDSNAPLPEVIIEQLGGDMAFIDTPDGQRLYSIRDWVYWVSGSKAKRRAGIWTDLKDSIEKNGGEGVMETIQHLEFDTAGGKQHMDFTDDHGLYQITQRMSDRSETVRKVKKYLADAGVILDQMRLDPEAADEQLSEARKRKYRAMGRDDKWIAVREQGMWTRKQFTETISALLGNKANFAQLTNDVYRGVWHRDKAQLCGDLGINAKENPRDYMELLGLYYTGIAEEICRIKLGRLRDDEFVPPETVREIIVVLSKQVGLQADEIAAALGIDLVTGRPLLTA